MEEGWQAVKAEEEGKQVADSKAGQTEAEERKAEAEKVEEATEWKDGAATRQGNNSEKGETRLQRWVQGGEGEGATGMK